jgi:nicotinamidase/pyrazinamidase
LDLGYKVFVFKDAIKELPLIPLPYDRWMAAGVQLIDFNRIEDFL